MPVTPSWSFPLLLVGVAGCAKHAPRLATTSWTDLFVPARYDYEELSASPGGTPTRTTVTETWTETDEIPPPEGFPGKVWVVDDTPDDGPTNRTLFVAGDRGLAYFATVKADGTPWTFEPKVQLPASFDGKTTWQGTFGEGAALNERSCHVEPTPYCDEGAAITCETHWATRSTWMRQHYCKGQGWMGYEAVTVSGGQVELTWSEEATRDGVSLPVVGIERRPFPEVVAHPAGSTGASP